MFNAIPFPSLVKVATFQQKVRYLVGFIAGIPNMGPFVVIDAVEVWHTHLIYLSKLGVRHE